MGKNNYRKNTNFNYHLERQKQEQREGDRRTNLIFGMADKTGASYVDEKYKEVEEKYGVEFAKPIETRSAPTTNSERPRALNLAYMKDNGTLLIQFRDGTICEYSDIPIDVWQDLKVTDSTGKYLRYAGIDDIPYKKVPKSQFPEEIRVLFD